MRRRRVGLWLLVALVFIGQSMAVHAQRLPCFHGSTGSAPSVDMDCHSGHYGNADPAAGQQDCCGDSCPDMTACVVPHAAGLSISSQILPAARNAPVDRYSVSVVTALCAPPFRPPAFSHV